VTYIHVLYNTHRWPDAGDEKNASEESLKAAQKYIKQVMYIM